MAPQDHLDSQDWGELQDLMAHREHLVPRAFQDRVGFKVAMDAWDRLVRLGLLLVRSLSLAAQKFQTSTA